MQVCTSLQTDNHTSASPLSFLQAGCSSCCPTNSVKAVKAMALHWYSMPYLAMAVNYECCCQAECLVETQANVYERFLSGMMAKDKKEKKHEEKSEGPDEDQDDAEG